MSDEAHAHEVVIIKRHGGHEDAHHGGVWKIAFADFMTAMMAFFLVMWLISANDKTKATIAKYFNPVELVDSTPQPRGLNDAKAGDPSIDRKSDKALPDAQSKDPKPDAPTKDAKPDTKAHEGKPSPQTDASTAPLAPPSPDATAVTAHDEADLTRDPYALLADLATKATPETPPAAKKPLEEARRGVGSQGNKGGEAFRDPFEPPVTGTGDQAPGTGVSVRLEAAVDGTPAPDGTVPTPPPATPAPHAAAKTAALASGGAPAAGGAMAETPPSAATPPPAAEKAESATAADTSDKPLPAAALRTRIAALAKGPDGAPLAGEPKLDVRRTDEGLLISLTDSADFTMFPSASARPAPKMVVLVEKIGLMLKTQKGSITVRGFTDSHPFKSDTYDNWRLSTARAHMAHYMLVQGGVGDDRIDRVEGYADHRPKNPKDPGAPENRRIEILLRDTTP